MSLVERYCFLFLLLLIREIDQHITVYDQQLGYLYDDLNKIKCSDTGLTIHIGGVNEKTVV